MLRLNLAALADAQVITTLQGEDLTVSLDGGVAFIDAAGEAATVTTADVDNFQWCCTYYR